MSVRGVAITATDGAYCPLVPPRLFAKRLRTGLYALTSLGLEKRCSRCREYWPADTEFFTRNKGGLHNYCKDCHLSSIGRSTKGIGRGRWGKRGMAPAEACA